MAYFIVFMRIVVEILTKKVITSKVLMQLTKGLYGLEGDAGGVWTYR